MTDQDEVSPIKTANKWYEQRWVIFLSLLLLYPLGVVLQARNPRTAWWRKIAGAVVMAPAFGLLALLALKPFWDFEGGMRSLRDFSLDFGRLTRPSTLEEHRRSQKNDSPYVLQISPDDAKLSWTDFRGPRRDGVYDRIDLAMDWQSHPPRELWRQPVGGGYASFVVGGGRAYTIEQRRTREAVTCYELVTGRELWAYEYDASFEETLGGDGPRATPTLVGGRVYSLGAAGHLHCLNATSGQVVWQRNILREFHQENLSWGLAGSPLVIDGKVLVTNSGQADPSVLAYDSATGNLLWKTGAGVQAYNSLSVMMLAGRRQVLNLAATSLNALDPASGEILWSFPWATSMGINCSQPLEVGADRIFLSSGYGKGCALVKIETANGKLQTREIWSNTRMKNKFNSSVVSDGYAYGLDEGVLCCVELETGDRPWKGGKYGYGSVVLAQGHLIVMSDDGRLAVVEATPKEYREKGSIRVFDDRTWNNFALIGGRLLARNHIEMALLDLRATTRGRVEADDAGRANR